MRLGQALSPTVWLPVTFAGGAVLNIEYKPSSASIEEMERLRAQGDDDSAQVNRVIQFIQEIVVDWDLTEDDGETKVPLTVEALRKVPTNIFTEIVKAVRKHQSAGEA